MAGIGIVKQAVRKKIEAAGCKTAAISRSGLSMARRVSRTLYDATWPARWRLISALYRRLPAGSRSRELLKEMIFDRTWPTFHRQAFSPEVRDRYFEYILTFFYDYPISRGDVVVQFGASFGEETSRFARAVGPGGRVIAVEPEANNLRMLRARFPQERFPHVTIVPLGGWNQKAKLQFLLGGEREHRIREQSARELTYEFWGVKDHLREDRYRGQTTIQVDTVDNILKAQGVTHVDFMLVETNGAELEVVLGMHESAKFVQRVGARGHVERDGIPISRGIAKDLQQKGFKTETNSEGMVLAHRRAIEHATTAVARRHAA